jgi:hypothetical protein
MEPTPHITSDFSEIFLPAVLVVSLTNTDARAGPKPVVGIGTGQRTDAVTPFG